MAITPVNTGAAANDGTGDPLRTAFTKLNDNLLDLVARTGPAVALGNTPATIALNPDGARAGAWHATLTGAAVTIAPSNVPSGVLAVYVLQVTQDATGGRAITWPANTTFLNGVSTVNPAPNAVSLITLITSNGGSTWQATIADARATAIDPLMFTPVANGDVYWRCPAPGYTLKLGAVGKQGTGTLAYAKSLAASPTSFSSVSGDTAFAEGDVLRVTLSSMGTWVAFDIPRIPT